MDCSKFTNFLHRDPWIFELHIVCVRQKSEEIVQCKLLTTKQYIVPISLSSCFRSCRVDLRYCCAWEMSSCSNHSNNPALLLSLSISTCYLSSPAANPLASIRDASGRQKEANICLSPHISSSSQPLDSLLLAHFHSYPFRCNFKKKTHY